MRFFNNKLSRINFLILLGILTYLYTNMSNDNGYVEAISKASPSVINIRSAKNIETRLFDGAIENDVIGSGIIISNDGYIITNMHVIEGKRLINVELDDGQVYKASLIGFDERSDLAVIKIVPSDPLTPIEVSNSSSVQIGDQVIAIGNAFGLGKTFTSGIISATGRDYGNPYLELIQTDAAINPGNSGGALINHKGNLIGMNTKIFSKTGSYTGIGFALPANKMIEVASEIIQFGSVKRSWIGDFRVKAKRFLLNNELAYGLEILELRNYGPLFNSEKIKPGDIILSINNESPTWENLTGALKNSFPGDEINFQILQDSEVNNYIVFTEAIPVK
ncbi:MAG: trypsin-like peptidase domain-containing protein [SAR86 cluster bacterium]|uniref:Trypsin-like peptidase domain-containing protein n=1 Tax=SAR86 cluster bacterium TaxID=2030880 RepID=A0A838XV67_9GAMM|nr:trypsin-like peptidase domain-containing protein [SAR86 cluster bacterium]